MITGVCYAVLRQDRIDIWRNDVKGDMPSMVDWLIVDDSFTSLQTQYRLYGRRDRVTKYK